MATHPTKEKLQGTWNAFSSQAGGKENPDAEAILTLKGDGFRIQQRDGTSTKGTFKLDPSTTPKSIDLKIEENDATSTTVLGIYQLEGDKLTLCVGDPGSGDRPKEFATRAGSQSLLVKFKRGKLGSGDFKRPWTILLYAAVDNSADDPFAVFADQVRRAIDDDPGIELVLFIDRSNKHAKRTTFLGDDFSSTRLYRVKNYFVERLSGGAHFPEITTDKDVNLNSADASNLQRFIAWGKANYPAQRYGLLIYSHANGRCMCISSVLGRVWRDKIRNVVIPYDMNDRKRQLSHLWREDIMTRHLQEWESRLAEAKSKKK